MVNLVFGHLRFQLADLSVQGFDFAWIGVRHIEGHVELIGLAPNFPSELGCLAAELLVESIEFGTLRLRQIITRPIVLPAVARTAGPSPSATKGSMGKDRDG
jgi:hypothetical protein